MKILRVEFDNFLSYGPGNRLDLADLGLVLIQGANLAATSASSNGAGKTSLIETLPWCFYGLTTKGMAADEVVNDIVKKDCRVSVFLEDAGKEYEITRYRKHSVGGNAVSFAVLEEDGWVSLAGVDGNETQRRIEQFLGASFPVFTNSVYFSQTNVKPFSEFTDKQIKEVFVKIFDLARYQAALEETRRDLIKLDKDITAQKTAGDILDRDIREISERIEGYRVSQAGFEDERKAALAEFDRKIAEYNAMAANIVKELKALPGIEEEVKKYQAELSRLPGLQRDLETYQEKSIRPFSDNKVILGNQARSLAQDLTDQRKLSTDIAAKVGTKCSECGRVIEKETLAGYLDTVNLRIEDLAAQEEKVRSLVIRVNAKLTELGCKEKEFKDEIARLRGLKETVPALQGKITLLRGKALEAKRHIQTAKDLEEDRNRKRGETSPYMALIEEAGVVGKEKQARLDEISKSIEESQEQVEYTRYWERAFGYSGIQSFLLDARTPFLNKQANHYATVVAGGEVRISFDTTEMTKKGAKDKFKISVRHAAGGKTYKSISGGERRRADICIAQAMYDLVRAYGRKPFEIACYDEPFDSSLDPEGIAGVTELLTDVSREIGTVLLVTHVPGLKAHCEKVIRVVKDRDGFSRIEE
jgi:DNA repair exonuclease SbcCD ATPase subunit